MLKRAVLLVLFCFVMSSSVVMADAADPSADAGTANPQGYKISANEVDAYNAAVKNCDTPSLECLVRYVTRFVAIEWVNDINGAPTNLVAPASTGTKGGDTGVVSPIASLPSGAVSGTFKLMGAMFSKPPAHTATYVADVINTAGYATPVYAQGLGFASLDPILNLWKTFRNVAYFFFIIIFMVIGFMIMLRQRISGQTAVTAQQAIPSVIISLILVTFSYAISGFLIDMMYVSMFLIVGLFQGITTTIQGNANTARQISGGELINFDILNLIWFFFKDTASQASSNITLVTNIFESAASSSGDAATGLAGILGGLTLTVVITVAVLIGTVRLFFELLKSYASVILYVVASPIILMFGAIPGKNVFGGWIKGIIGNLIAFPVVLLMVVLYVEFTKGATNGASTGGFLPPFLFGNGTTSNMLGPMLGLAIILALPDIVKEVKNAAGAGKGGIGTMLAGWAGNNLKAGWSGKGADGVNMPFGLGGKRIAAGIAATPFGVGGGILGLRTANKMVAQRGLSGKEKLGAQLAGLGIGAGLGFNAPRIATQLGKGAYTQTRDSLVKLKTDEFVTNILAAQDQESIRGEGNIVADNKKAQEQVQPTSNNGQGSNLGKGPSSSSKKGLR